MTDFADRFWRSTNGLTLYARDYAGGSGPARLPVVCLHGLTRNSRDFGDVAPGVAAAGRRVLVADVRGRGRSERDPDPGNYNPGVYAQDVAGLLDALGIARALFVGTSMGGLITMLIASARPGLVAGAVLNDIGPQVAPEGLARIAAAVGRAPPIETWDDAAEYARLVNGMAFPGRDRTFWLDFARRTFSEGPDGRVGLDYDPAIAQAFRTGDDEPAPLPDLWPLFHALAQDRPLLLIRGGNSDLLDAPIAARMREAAPRMVYAEVPGIGHAPMLDEPEAAAAIRDFLAAAP
jgi:pimeloyl-ACP methyl ester carboxylesterase